MFPGGPPVSTRAHPDRHVDVRLPPARGLHRRRVDAAWSAPRRSPPGGGSGVDFTEYRVNGGAWAKPTRRRSPFPVTVATEGEHTVEYRSADKAGNVEAAKSVAFGIEHAVRRASR